MNIRSIAIATSILCAGAAFAAPNDTATAASGTAATPHKTMKHVKKLHANKHVAVHHVGRHHVASHAAVKHHAVKHMASAKHNAFTASARSPTVNLDDRTRQSRMDDALAKFRQNHS